MIHRTENYHRPLRRSVILSIYIYISSIHIISIYIIIFVLGPPIYGYPLHTELPLYTCTFLSIHGPSSPLVNHPLWTETIIISVQRLSSEHMDHSLYTLTIFSGHGSSSMYIGQSSSRRNLIFYSWVILSTLEPPCQFLDHPLHDTAFGVNISPHLKVVCGSYLRE